MSNLNQTPAAVSVKFSLIVAAVLVLIGCALVVFGCASEAHYQLDLLRASGAGAVDAYLSQVTSHQLSFAAFMVESVTGHCYARGAFLQGVGFWFVFVLAPATIVLQSALRRFVVRDQGANRPQRLIAAH
ncbi:hypothetical protein SAMN05443245_7459 [Paraburkholderia fungorum]|uniref:Uncharacterized protein n=1 Tax=Paraburkholderia fungorum TaxID=134537 RepID=A0A1H1JY48_9BURK|nr:hypothetical protein [Paraburkholderia fungorum]SDR54575.1 hypothetical protein SAMN05443245_7459 [Paraburkholderia fungorum]